jgi:outer membrane receptor protein involved in Fe transport
VRADWQAAEWLGVMGGLVYERTHASNYVFRSVADRPGSPSGVDPAASAFLEPHSYDDVAGYLQAQASPLQALGLVAGLRYSLNSSYGGFLAPRAGVVWQAAEPLSLKLLYGRAFRTPSFFEKYVNTVNVLYGGDIRRQEPGAPFALQAPYVLQPEAIDTVDLAAEGTWQRHAARVTLFYLNTHDKIDRVRRAARVDASGTPVEQSPVPQYGNAEGYSVVGVETEVRGQPWEGLSYFANAATRYAFQGALSDTLPWRTPLTANLGLTWRLPAPVDALSLTTSVMAVGERSGPLSPERDVGLFPEDTLVVPGYVLWNANASWAFSEQVELSLLLHNLLDQAYGYPEYIRARGPVVPGGPGFAAYGRLSVTL